jgi:hypothetical protein
MSLSVDSWLCWWIRGCVRGLQIAAMTLVSRRFPQHIGKIMSWFEVAQVIDHGLEYFRNETLRTTSIELFGGMVKNSLDVTHIAQAFFVLSLKIVQTLDAPKPKLNPIQNPALHVYMWIVDLKKMKKDRIPTGL